LNKQTEESTGLDPREQKVVRHRTRMRPAVIHEIVREEGEEELSRSFAALWWSGIAAGLSMGFSLVSVSLLNHYLPDAPWAHVIASAGYTSGFIIVILARQQLFTENTITALLPVINQRRGASWDGMLRLWGIVLAANAVGAFFFALAVESGLLYFGLPSEVFAQPGLKILKYPVEVMFVKAIAAGWLIAALVWVLPTVENSKFVVIFFFTWLIGLGDYAHIVAGMAEVWVPILEGQVSLGRGLLVFFLPTLAGNIVGGSAIFALINYAQVRREVGEE